jgi:hypothetical protein
MTPAAKLPQVLTTPVVNLPPVSATPVANCHRYQQHRRQICHRWQTLSCENLREFSKKFETALLVNSEAWGKLVQEKNQKQKIS